MLHHVVGRRHQMQRDFVRNLAEARSWRSSLTGADSYRQLPLVASELLPSSPESAA